MSLCEKAVDCMSLYCSAWKGTGNNYKKNYKMALCLRVTLTGDRDIERMAKRYSLSGYEIQQLSLLPPPVTRG